MSVQLMRPLIIALCLAAVRLGSSRAQETPELYPGCEVPPKAFAHDWYFDPKAPYGGDGSRAHPWNKIEALVSPDAGKPLLSSAPYRHLTESGYQTIPDPSAPVHPGDRVLLMTGNYGRLNANMYGQTITNSDFVTIEAAPGQTPVLAGAFFADTNKWRLHGVKIRSAGPDWRALVHINGKSSDIVVDDNDVASADDISAWDQSAWRAQGRVGLLTRGGSDVACISIVGNRISNLKSGAGLAGDKTLFAGNTIDQIGGDFLDYAADNLIIRANYLTNSNEIGDGNHNDFMQGQSGSPPPPGETSNYYHDITIENNVMIRTTDPNRVRFPTGIQGIDAFDEDWTNIHIRNNVVITSACHGIAMYSVHHADIINNTVLDDGSDAAKNLKFCLAWILVGLKSHQGLSSNDVVLRNNLATDFSLGDGINAFTYDHNICVSIPGRACTISSVVDNVPRYYRLPGRYEGILLSRQPVERVVRTWDPAQLRYDAHLRPGSEAIRAGSSQRAPPIDVEGATRIPPIDVGAYKF